MKQNKAHWMYPCLLDLSAQRVTVFGGGEVAERRVMALIEAQAGVEVISPCLTDALRKAHASGHLSWHPRKAQDEDVLGRRLVFIATDDPQRNAQLHQLAHAQGCLVNNASDPEHSTLWVPATIRRGPVTIALNTGAPVLTRAIKQVIEQSVTTQWGALARDFGQWRIWAKANLSTPALRRQFWQHIASALPEGVSWSSTQWHTHISAWLKVTAPELKLPPVE